MKACLAQEAWSLEPHWPVRGSLWLRGNAVGLCSLLPGVRHGPHVVDLGLF